MEIFKYYGYDILISLLYIIHIWMISKKLHSGWLLGIIASILNVAFCIWISSIAGIISSLIYIGIHYSAYKKPKEIIKMEDIKEDILRPAA